MLAMNRAQVLTATVLACALGTLNWRIWSGAVDTSPLDRDPVTATAPPALARPALSTTAGLLAPLVSYPETTARPLFNPTRSPVKIHAAEALPTATSPTNSPDGYRVLGIVREANGEARALITSPDQPHGAWLSAGQDAAGWRLTAIAETDVTIAAGQTRHVLQLYGAVHSAAAANADIPKAARLR